MKHKTNSTEHTTERIGYPTNRGKLCILCESEVKYAYPDDGKMVRTLDGKVYQIVNNYKCINPECEFHEKAFNPAQRFDYCGRHFGADVFKFVADEFLCLDQKPGQITKRLNEKYNLDISIDTVRRMCDDVLKLKALKIDERTKEIIEKQGFILFGFDGQDPGSDSPAIWSFKDMISNRILATYQFESLDYQILHETIEEITAFYGVKIIGWVSDKQNVITKCHDTYYQDIPHQICQYHFLKNTWSHLTSFDSNVFIYLKKVVKGLYIHSASKSATVMFENVGKVSVRKAFKNIDKDLQSMTRVKNKRFKELRGIWFFEELDGYVSEMEKKIKDLDPSYRFAKIFSKTAAKLRDALNTVRQTYLDTIELNEYFQSIRKTLCKDEFKSIHEREEQLAAVYEGIFSKAAEEDPTMRLEDCKSFLANKKSGKTKIMGEWCRLWNSYRPGLFVYAKLPIDVKTNNASENGFSREKQAIFNRVAKSMVGYMISTRGEDYLRIKHCTYAELKEDIIEQYSDEVVRALRKDLNKSIKKATATWRIKERLRKGIEIDTEKYYIT
jgi:hypothetical protein